jgi:hypothetical protein
MTIRRFLALLTCLATLHTSVSARAAQCAMVSESARATDHDMPMDGHEMGAAHHAKPDAHDAAPDDATPRHACDMIVGCSAVAVASPERVIATTVVAPVERVRESSHDAPSSFVPAPEPPPPKDLTELA